MASSNNLDALSADAELPFGHPGRRSDDTPEGFSQSPLVDQGRSWTTRRTNTAGWSTTAPGRQDGEDQQGRRRPADPDTHHRSIRGLLPHRGECRSRRCHSPFSTRHLLMGPNYQCDYMPDEDDAIVHYGPGDQPLCGSESMTAAYTDDPALVAGCADCLELAAEDLEEDNEHWANCLHCQQEISARNGVEWRRIARAPCPHCGKAGW